jgi:hypothetical protein
MPSGILFNDCYGGFGLTEACVSEYKACTGKDIKAHIPHWDITGRSNPVLVDLYHEFGSKWMSDKYAKIRFTPILESLLEFVKISEYDGQETAGVDFNEAEKKYFDEFLAAARAGALEQAYTTLEERLAVLQTVKGQQIKLQYTAPAPTAEKS